MALFYVLDRTGSVNKEPVRGVSTDYSQGVNAALDGITLLNLELRLSDTNMTWGAMSITVANRLGVLRTTYETNR
jgi:hypothetical protein